MITNENALSEAAALLRNLNTGEDGDESAVVELAAAILISEALLDISVSLRDLWGTLMIVRS